MSYSMESSHCLHVSSLLALLITLSCVASARHCAHHQFWDRDKNECRPCAKKCPENQIILSRCGRKTDTVCGPFKEFKSFKQPDVVHGPLRGRNRSAIRIAQSRDQKVFSHSQRASNGLQNEPIVQKDDGEYWKNLAFALIGVVCVLIFVSTIIVLLACRKLHQTAAVKRPEEDDDDDSGYVVIRAMRPPDMVCRPPPPYYSDMAAPPPTMALLGGMTDAPPPPVSSQGAQRIPPKRGTYKPLRRLLNYDADDVFESEDSAGSRTSKKGQLMPIPERSVCSDSDDTGLAAHVPV